MGTLPDSRSKTRKLPWKSGIKFFREKLISLFYQIMCRKCPDDAGHFAYQLGYVNCKPVPTSFTGAYLDKWILAARSVQ